MVLEVHSVGRLWWPVLKAGRRRGRNAAGQGGRKPSGEREAEVPHKVYFGDLMLTLPTVGYCPRHLCGSSVRLRLIHCIFILDEPLGG